MLRAVIKAFALPPLSLFALAFFGLLLCRKRPRLGRLILLFSGAMFLLLSIPAVADALLRGLERHGALASDSRVASAQAVVVLSCGLDPAGYEYGGATIDPLTLQRVRYAAWLARKFDLPVLASGGVLAKNTPPIGKLMADVLHQEFDVEVCWAETRSQTTRENARFSAELLRASGIATVLLVTNAWHMPRAVEEFEATGLNVIPAPTGFTTPTQWTIAAFLPSATALTHSRWAIHEQLGLIWYRLTRD
ncbi:MAG: YdcF family protein [Planctomycetota bacterium]